MTKQIEKQITEVVHTIEPSLEFSEKLLKEIKATPQKEHASRKAPQWRWIPVMAVIAFVITLIVVSPESVWASLRGLFDFLPGIGLVHNDENTLYLTEPVSVTEDGVALTIDQVVSDGNQTVVSFHSDNLPNGGKNCAYSFTRLLLPDGKTLLPTGGGGSTEGGMLQARVQFFPLPEGVTQATLHAGIDPDDPDISSCTDPKEWNVDFTLSTTKPSNVDLLPVVESTAQSTTEHTAESTIGVRNDQVQIFIDKSVTLDDGYILYGHFNLLNPYWSRANFNYTESGYLSVTAQDASGKEIPLEPTDVISDSTGFSVDNTFAVKVATKDFTAPLTMHVKNLRINAIYDPQDFGIPVFTFDAGSDPQIGQSWEINKEVEVDGIKIDFQNIQVVQEPTDQGRDENLEKGYTVTIHNSSAEYFSGSYFCQGEGNGTPDYGEGSASVFTYYYSGGLPYGQVTCNISDANFLLPGNWKIDWQPPIAEN